MKYAPMPVPTGKHPRTCAEHFSKHQCQVYAINCFELKTGINLPFNIAAKTEMPRGFWLEDVECFSGDQVRGYALDVFIANYDFGLVRVNSITFLMGHVEVDQHGNTEPWPLGFYTDEYAIIGAKHKFEQEHPRNRTRFTEYCAAPRQGVSK